MRRRPSGSAAAPIGSAVRQAAARLRGANAGTRLAGYARADLGGGTGTSRPRASAGADRISGHSRPLEIATKGAARSKMSRIFSAPALGTAGPWRSQASRALLTQRQMAQGLHGSKVSLAAAPIDSVLA